ncbi:MAG TPA: response regulator [Burkholderiales bacterium]|nr:response regulator [Burkholderiales bacterium]
MTGKIRVLMIEDSEDDALLVARELQRNGFEVVSLRVDTAPELQDALARSLWDVVLSDYMMPSFNGLQALAMVRQHDPDLPFIVVSGAVGEELAVDTMKSGAQDYVMKNNLARLTQAVRREIADARMRRERKQAQLALAASEERLQLVVRATRDAIYDRDRRAGVDWFNEACIQLIGPLKPGEPLHVLWIAGLHPDDRDRVLLHFESAWQSGGVREVEYRLMSAGGDYVNILDRCFVVSDHDGTAVRMIGAMLDVTELKRMDIELATANQRLKALSANVLHIQENERRHIARELHDEVGQLLTALKISLDALARSGIEVPRGMPPSELAGMAGQALAMVRDITLALRPPQLDDLGLGAALRWHLDQQSRVSNWESVFEIDELPARLDSGLETACYRVVQEALTNAARHARASQIALELRVEPPMLRLRVHDDGEGFDTGEIRARILQGSSAGIAGMEERVALVGGRLQVASMPGKGTTVTAEFPLSFARESAGVADDG